MLPIFIAAATAMLLLGRDKNANAAAAGEDGRATPNKAVDASGAVVPRTESGSIDPVEYGNLIPDSEADSMAESIDVAATLPDKYAAAALKSESQGVIEYASVTLAAANQKALANQLAEIAEVASTPEVKQEGIAAVAKPTLIQASAARVASDPTNLDAVKDFQRMAGGLVIDGKFGPKTSAAMYTLTGVYVPPLARYS